MLKDAKLKLIEFIMNQANESQIFGLQELIEYKDINAFLEKYLGGKDFDNYISTQVEIMIADDVYEAIEEIKNGNFGEALKALSRITKKW